jgi:hypothetical protein
MGVEEKQVAVAAEHGVAPATNPLSYRQLNDNHGPRFHGWYCRCVVSLNNSFMIDAEHLVTDGDDGQPGDLRQEEACGHAGHRHERG